jgi:hypothetical protein
MNVLSDKDSKNNIRKEWQNIYKQATEYLSKTGSATGAGSRSMSNSNNNNNVGSGSGGGAKQQLEEADIMSLLQTAAPLPAYINAPGECFAETVRSALGELMLLCCAAQAWALDVRDSLYDPIYPPVPLSKLKSLETEGVALKVVHKDFLSNYRSVLREYDDISKATDALVRKSISTTTATTSISTSSGGSGGSSSSSSSGSDTDSMTLTQAHELLQRERNLPRAQALHSNSASLNNILQTAERLTSDVSDVLLRAEICTVRKHR